MSILKDNYNYTHTQNCVKFLYIYIYTYIELCESFTFIINKFRKVP